MKIATIAGRSTEARKKLQELLAADARDDEIAEWLALVLFSDPAWLDSFILTVPEGRRVGLTRLTLLKIGKLQADAAWELIRASPYARQAARSDVTVERRKGLDILGYCLGSPLAAKTLLDPSLEFTDQEIARSLSFCYGNKNIQSIVEAWVQGRWKDKPPGLVRDKWGGFRSIHKDDLPEVMKTFPPEVCGVAEQYNIHWEQRKVIEPAPVGTLPTHEELAKLNEEELHETLSSQGESGTYIPLTTLVQLPEKLRKTALENFFSQSDTFHQDMLRNSIAEAEQLDLTPVERQSLLKNAALLMWKNQGDYETALDWAGRIPDAKGRADCEEQLLTQLAETDPRSALDYLSQLPASELRDKIEKIATEALP